MRLLRAGVPQQGPHPDPAPADRARCARSSGAELAGDHAPGRGAARRTTSTRRGHLRRRRHVPDRLPGGHQHRDAGEATAQGRRRPASTNGAWDAAAKHWGGVTRGARAGADGRPQGCPPPPSPRRTRLRGAWCSAPTPCPLYSAELPRRRPRRGSARRRPATVDAVYFPACVGTHVRTRRATARPGVQAASSSSASGPGSRSSCPDGIDGLCCGTPWSSKGIDRRPGDDAARRPLAALRAATGTASCPIVCDASSCTEGLRQAVESDARAAGQRALRMVDAVEFARTNGSCPGCPATRSCESLALHPTCSSTRLGLERRPRSRRRRPWPTRVEVPENWGCCAFAGDRGMLHPELTASATATAGRRGGGHGRRRARLVQPDLRTGHDPGHRRAQYRHVLELLEEVTR